MPRARSLSRRRLLATGAALAAAPLLLARPARGGSALQFTDRLPPVIAQVGDVEAHRALLWGRANRPARLVIELAERADFAGARRILGPHALDNSDFTARIDLGDLPADRTLHYRLGFTPLDGSAAAPPVLGRFRTAPTGRRAIRFVWGGDTAGQGFGINPEFGGMRIYETMRQREPDFFLHSGDTIYADGPILSDQPTVEGHIWRNIVTPEVSKVAETLDEFRGRHRYNLLDPNIRAFAAEVPQIWQWDDHEVTNNWSFGKDLSADPRYTTKQMPLLVGNATRAFLDYAPLRPAAADEQERIYRHIPYGELLDVFVVDMRSYRGNNGTNRETTASEATALLGEPQLQWLTEQLKSSRALWKVIASDMPIGLLIGDGANAGGQPRFENTANGDGPPLGRELELARLLAELKRAAVRNVVWLTADVHYCAAHHYAPERAQFSDFDAFYEFVAGPLNAGSFGPAPLDPTFGPKVLFHRPPPKPNTSPFAGFQFFGQVDIAPENGNFTVALVDIDGRDHYRQVLRPRS